MDSFLECSRRLEIEGLLAGTKDSHKTLNDREIKNQYPEAKYDNYAQVEEKGLVTMNNEVRKIKRPYARTLQVSSRIDVRSHTKEEIYKKMGELYERTDEGWRCLVCDHTNKGQGSSNIRMHVETHLDGLVYTCNVCSKEFKLRNS